MERFGEFEQEGPGAVVMSYVLYAVRIVAAGGLALKATFGLLSPAVLNQQNVFYICDDRGIQLALTHIAMAIVTATLLLGFASRVSAIVGIVLIGGVMWHCSGMMEDASAFVLITLIVMLSLISSHGGGRFALDGNPSPRRFAGWR